MTLSPQQIDNILSAEHDANHVIYPETGERITSYQKLATDPLTKETCTKTMVMELDNITKAAKQPTNQAQTQSFSWTTVPLKAYP